MRECKRIVIQCVEIVEVTRSYIELTNVVSDLT